MTDKIGPKEPILSISRIDDSRKPELSSTDKKISKFSIKMFMETLIPGFLMKMVGFSAEGLRGSLHKSVSTPAAFGLVNSVSIMTGSMTALAEYSYVKKVKACWKQFSIGFLGVVSGVASATGGILLTASSAIGMATTKIGGSFLNKLTLAGSGVFAFTMIAMSINSFYKVRAINELKAEIKEKRPQQKLEILRKMVKDEVGKAKLERLIGPQEVEKIEKIKVTVNPSTISEVLVGFEKSLDKNRINNAAFSFIGLVTGFTTAAVDIFTAGALSVVCNALNLAITSISELFSTSQSISSIQGSKEGKVIKYTLLALSTILSVGAFVAASIGSAGAVPLALFVGSLAAPFVSLIYENTLASKKESNKDLILSDDDHKAQIQSCEEAYIKSRSSLVPEGAVPVASPITPMPVSTATSGNRLLSEEELKKEISEFGKAEVRLKKTLTSLSVV